MKRKEVMIMALGVILIGLYVVGSLTTNYSHMSEIVTTVTAVLGVFAIWIQLRKEHQLNEAQFIMEYNNTFIQNPELINMEAKLEQFRKTHIFKWEESERQAVIDFLVYNEALAALVFSDVLSIRVIDDLFSYRFFLVMNNPVIQKEELIPECEYYRGCIKLYKKWVKYKEKNDLPIVLGEHRLDRNFKEFNKYAESGNGKWYIKNRKQKKK